jgi:hypothetical protein
VAYVAGELDRDWLPELIPFNQQVHQVLSDAHPNSLNLQPNQICISMETLFPQRLTSWPLGYVSLSPHRAASRV